MTESLTTTTELASKIERFRELKRKNIEAARLNHRAVVEEDRVKKLPSNHARKQERTEKKKRLEELKRESELAGVDFERVQNLDYTPDECGRWFRRINTNADKQSCDYEDFTLRQYNKYANRCRRTSIDIEQYELMKAKMRPAEFYPTRETFVKTSHQPSKDDIERLSDELNKQAIRRAKALVRKRRLFNDPTIADIDYINEKNRIFNETVERFYGKYTAEIKQNLERGTAV